MALRQSRPLIKIDRGLHARSEKMQTLEKKVDKAPFFELRAKGQQALLGILAIFCLIPEPALTFDSQPEVTPKQGLLFSASPHAATGAAPDKTAHTEAVKTKMIDTINTVVSQPLDPTTLSEIQRNQHRAWTTTYSGAFLSGPEEFRTTFRAKHIATDLRAGMEEDTLNWVHCSLPKLLDQPNGKQLKNSFDLHRTRAACDTIIQTLHPRARTLRPLMKLTRLDLALNLPLNPRYILAIHQHARHPRIRRETELYYNDPPNGAAGGIPYQRNSLNTVVFNGAKTRISLYDKARKEIGFSREWPDFSKCIRVEIQLKTQKHIAKLFGREEQGFVTLEELCFEQCYRVFRMIMMEFEKVAKMPAFKPNMATLLAILQHYPETWEALGGVEPLQWYRTTKGITDKQFGDTRRKIRKLHLQLHNFRWAEVLPEDKLPDIVDVDENGIETLIPSPTSFRTHDEAAG